MVAPAAQAGVHQHLHAVDVEERQHRDEGIVVVELQTAPSDLGDVGHEVAVREHHALRQPGRAGRVRQHDDVVGFDGDLLVERWAGDIVDGRVALRLDR